MLDQRFNLQFERSLCLRAMNWAEWAEVNESIAADKIGCWLSLDLVLVLCPSAIGLERNEIHSKAFEQWKNLRVLLGIHIDGDNLKTLFPIFAEHCVDVREFSTARTTVRIPEI